MAKVRAVENTCASRVAVPRSGIAPWKSRKPEIVVTETIIMIVTTVISSKVVNARHRSARRRDRVEVEMVRDPIMGVAKSNTLTPHGGA